MSYLLEILGRGLLGELSDAFHDLLHDDGRRPAKELEADVEREPDNVEFQRRLAVRMLADRRYPKAQSGFSAVLQSDASDRVSRLGLACTLDELGRTRAALEHLRQAYEQHPHDGPTLFALGFCLEKLGESDDALGLYEAALAVVPSLRGAHERVAAIHLKRDHVPQAIEHYEHLCFDAPDDLSAVMTLANLYLRAGRCDDAVRRYQYAITLDPDNWEAKSDLISAHAAAGDYPRALAELGQCIAAKPESADLYVRLGDLQIKCGDEKAALTAYSKAQELHPDYLAAAIKVGTVHLRGGKYEPAAKAFARAVEINDRILHAFVGLAVAQQAMGLGSEAQVSLEQAAAIEPNSTLLFSEIARLQLKVAAARQKQRYLATTGIAAEPDGPVDDRIASMLERQIGHLRQAVEDHPNHADLRYRLGLLLRQSGDLGGAIEAFQRAVTINPQYFKAMVKLSLALREAGRADDAIQVARNAMDIDPQSVELHYELGLIYAERNLFAQAIDRFDHAVRHAPENLDYVGNLALSLQNMGLTDRASETWRTLCELTDQRRESLQPRASHSRITY